MHGANIWLKLLYDRMHIYLLEERVIHADETTMQVLDEEGKSATSKSYMWLYASSHYGRQIFLYDYQPSRAKRHPKTFLGGFNRYLQTDGYPGYNDVSDVTLVGCFAMQDVGLRMPSRHCQRTLQSPEPPQGKG